MNSNSADAGVFVAPRAGTAPIATAAASRQSAAVDRQGFDSAVLVVQAGATTGTPTSFTVTSKVQASADGSTGWADLTEGAVTCATANGVARLNVRLAAANRYIRVSETVAFVAGTAPTVGAASCLVLCGPDEIPAL